MGGVGGVIEAPNGGHALLAVFGKGRAERKVVVALQHHLALGEVLASVRGGAERSGMRQSCLSNGLGTVMIRIRGMG